MPPEEWTDEWLMERIKEKPEEGIGSFFKRKASDKVWWVNTIGQVGLLLFSFDKETVFNLFRDYPWKLTPEQKEIFDKENPYWADFFKDRE